MKRSAAIVTAILLSLPLPAFAQFGTEVTGAPFPTTWKYVPLFGHSQSASQADSSSLVFLYDDVRLTAFSNQQNLAPSSSGNRDVAILADTVRLGPGNLVVLQSTKSDKSVRNFILLCRHLIVDPDAKLDYYGTTLDPLILDIAHGALPNSYPNGLGSRFIIAAESVEYGPGVLERTMQYCNDSYSVLVRNAPFSRNRDLLPDRFGSLPDIVSNSWIPQGDKDRMLKALSPPTAVPTDASKATAIEFENLRLRGIKDSTAYFGALFTFSENQEGIFGDGSMPPATTPFEAFFPLGIAPIYDPARAVFNINLLDTYGNKAPAYLNPSRAGIPRSTLVAQLCGNPAIEWSLTPEALRNLPSDLYRLWSKWEVEWLAFKDDQLLQAELTGNKAKEYAIVREILARPLNPPISADDEAFHKSIKDIVSVENMLSDYVNSEDVDVSSVGRRYATILSKGFGGPKFIAPTDVLIDQFTQPGHNYVGTVNPQDSLLSFHVTLELRADPYLTAKLKEQLHSNDQQLQPGMVSGVRWLATLGQLPGVHASHATVNGTKIDAQFDVPSTQADSFLVGLVTQGIPLHLAWIASDNQTGDIGDMFARLSRKIGQSLTVSSTSVQNATLDAANINYVELADHSYAPLTPPVHVASNGGSSSWPDAVKGKVFSIPDEAIEWDDGPIGDMSARFAAVPSSATIKTATITNRIPAIVGGQQQLAVLHLDVSVDQMDNTGSVVTSLGHVSLAPADCIGSTTSFSYLDHPNSPLHIRIRGKAILANGSIDLKEIDSPLLAIDIGTDSLVANP